MNSSWLTSFSLYDYHLQSWEGYKENQKFRILLSVRFILRDVIARAINDWDAKCKRLNNHFVTVIKGP